MWLLTEEAIADLEAVGEYGGETYRQAAADTYLAAMRELFELLAANPYMSRERPETGRPLRLHRFRAHHVLYTIDNEDVVIVRVLGARQDWQNLGP